MDSSDSIAELVKVVLRVRPRVDSLPGHPQHNFTITSGTNDPTCVNILGRHQVKILPSKILSANSVAEKFGSPSGRDKKEKIFNFETILGPDSTQEDIYSTVADTVYSSVLGYNAAIFAYGSTGTGKTYTMTGTRHHPGLIPRVIEDVFRGIQNVRSQNKDVMFHVELSYVEMYNNGFRNLLRAVSDEVDRVEGINGDSDMLQSELDELLQVGLSEAAFEQGVSRFVDLSHKLDKITVHESAATGVYLCGPNIRIPVKSIFAAHRLFAIGNKQRAETSKNSYDRSHAVMTMHIESKVTFREGGAVDSHPEHTSTPPYQEKKSGRDTPSTGSTVRSELRLGKIHLVDLAGSERLSETKAEGDKMTETQNINKSLLALGEVLHALALNASINSKNTRKRSLGEGRASRDDSPSLFRRPSHAGSPGHSEYRPPTVSGEMHVPYLNSKLTHLLKDSLGGNSKTVMITTIACESEHYAHILHSLNYASRAMKVRNLVHPVRVEISETELISDLSNERDVINQLKERMMNRGPNGRERPLPRYPSVGRPPQASSNGSVRGASPLRSGQLSSSQSVASLSSSAGNTTAVGSRRPRTAGATASPSPVRNRLPGQQKAYTLKLNSIQAQQLPYVSFPLCPVLKFTVDKQQASTSKNLYSRSVATFPESFEFEVGALKYRAGLDLAVEAMNVSPLTGDLSPIGEGLVDIQTVLPALNAQQTVAIELQNALMQPAGLVLIGAVLLDRPVGNSISYPTPTHTSLSHAPQTPHSPSAVQGTLLEFDPTRHSSGVKDGVFRVDRIVCHDLALPTSMNPITGKAEPPKSDLFVVVQVGNDSLRTDATPGKCKQANVYAAFDRPNMVFDVEFDQLPSETLHAAVFEVATSVQNNKPTKKCIGRAKAPLFSLVGRNDGIYTPASEFAMQLKDDDGTAVGKISLFLLFSKSNQSLRVDTARSLFSSPSKTGASSPTKHLRSLGMSPRLNNIRVPSGFNTGWIRINSIAATNLNKFRLVGNTAKYQNLREAPMTPVPSYLKHSELLGKQDPFLVVEAGDFWGSYSKVLLNQGWDCRWDQVAFCCYLNHVEAAEENMRVSVYDRSCSGYHNVFIGFASLPLINMFAAKRVTETTIEMNVVDRRGKVNGKLQLKYTWEPSDEKERWSNGIITRVCGDGSYDVRYDDGDEEFSVFKDVIRLISRSKQMHPALGFKRSFTAGLFRFQNGDKVEVNDKGRGLWFPARVVRDNGDGSYDLESDYDIQKHGVNADNLRIIEAEQPVRTGHKRTDSFSRRLDFEGSIATGAGCRGKYKVRDMVEGNYKCKGTWYVGKVIKVHSYEQHCTYDIDYLTGEYESEVAEDMIRTESTHTVLVGATSAYDLRQLRATRSEVSVVVPMQRTGFSGADAAKARAAGRDEKTQSKFQAGQDVEVNFRGHGRFYPGVVEVDYENGVYDVVYESGERDVDIAEDFLRIPLLTGEEGDSASPEKQQQLVLSKMYKFEVGDRVEANFREIGKFIPGIITRDRGHGVFDIHYYDGRDESKVSFELIRLADPNAFFSPAKRSKFVVGQSVECNCERLGVWYHAQIRNVFPDGVYNIQYDDGETEYDVEEDMLRPGGAYSPGIASLKPFFKVGDRVKVACRSQEVDHELRSLSAIKQRIMEERKRLAEGKLVVAKRGAMQEQVNDAVAAAHRTLQGFKIRVGYSGELSCCQAENNLRSDDDESEGFTRVSSQSFRKLEEVESAFASDPSAPKLTEPEAIESLNDAITKAIVVEQSLGHIARASKEEELAKAHSAHLLCVVEKEKADELALARAIDEAKARKRNNFSREEEMRTVRDAYQKAELELGHIMAARQLVLEQDEALKNAKQRADLEARCMNGAQRKGEKAAVRLKEEDRQRMAMAEFNVKEAHRNGHQHHHHHGKKSKLDESPGDRVRSSLGSDGAREREALREALIRVKETNTELNEAKTRAAQAGREFASADSLAQSTQKELQDILDTNRQAEYTLTEDSTLTSEFKEYLKAGEAISSYTAQANSKRQRKETDLHKAEAATQLRMHNEENAAVAAEKRVFAEESMIRAARSGEMEDAKCAMREANSYGEQQGDEIIAATTASKTEAAELATAKVFAEDERKFYASARDIAMLASGLLRVIIADQREREYRALEEAKSAARTLSNELESLCDIISARDIRRINTTAAAETEALAIAQFRMRLAHDRNSSSTSSTSVTTAEKTALNLKIVRAQNGRFAAEEDIQRLLQERMLLEENARIAQKKGKIEESIAQSNAEEEATREVPLDRFTDPVKREQLLHFSSYSSDECKAVRMAISHIEANCTALQEAKACAIMQIDAIDNCRDCVQEEFSSLSSLSVIERDELRVLLPALSVAELQEHLATSKVRAIEANRALSLAKQKASERKKLLHTSKEKTSEVLEELSKAQEITQHISAKDFSPDRMKVSVVEGAQLAVWQALSDANHEEKARQALESAVESSLQNAIQAAHRASGSERLRNREEETTRQAVAAAEGICMDDEEQLLSLLAACTHSDAQIEALREALDAVERETEDIVTARQHSEKEGASILKALAKEENILLVKAEWDQQKAEAELGIAKKLLEGRVALMNNSQNALERDALALDVMVSTLERAAKELVTRGDDDIDDFHGYQRAFKRYQCKRQKALEYHKHRDNKKSKAGMAHHAREGEEDTAMATENRIYELQHEASVAVSHDNVPAEVKALHEARKLCNESANALAAAKEYAVAEEELYAEAQDEMDEEKLVLRASRDHAEEAWILLAKALSVLPVKHRTPMGLMLLNGGDGFFNGVVVRPRKKAPSGKDEKACDPGLLKPLLSDMDNVHGNHTLRAADFKDDEFLPDRDSKLLSFQFDANPKKAALREAQENVDRALEFLDAARSRTEDAEKKYRIANAAATEEGKCVVAQEKENADTSRRLSENFDGVEAEKAQLAKVRADLSNEDKNTAGLRSMKEGEVKKVAPFAQNRKRCEGLADKHAADRAKAEEAAQLAHRAKDIPGMERALTDAKKHCDLQAGALSEAAQSAAKECSAWGNGTNGANKEKGSAEKAHALADEEARLLGLIRSAQLGQGMEAYRAACREAEGAKDYYEETLRGMDGFAQFVDDLKAANAEREAELTEDTKALPAYQDYEKVRNMLDDECKRAQTAHDQHDQEVANALAAREVKAADGVEAEKLEDQRVAAEDAAHHTSDKDEEARLAAEARQFETEMEDAYSRGTDSANVETEAWKAAARYLEDEKEALTAAHEVSLETTAQLVKLRAEQIDREMASLRDASNHAQECANRYEVANARAMQAAEALNKSRSLLSARETALGEEVKSIPDYGTYLDLLDAALSATDQASEFEQEKLSERAQVDDVMAAKKQSEEGVAVATAKRTAAAAAVVEAQQNDDIDSEQQALEELKQLYDDEEKAVQEAKEHAEQEAHRWGIATDFADEEGSARIMAKDRTNEALRLLTRLLLEKERAEVDAKKQEVLDEEQAYRKLRDAVAVAKAKTAELVEACRMPDVVAEEVKNSPEYDRYQSRFSTVSADANRPVVDHDIINAAEIERAKDARQSCSREEVAAGKAETDRNNMDVIAEEMRQLPDLLEESNTVDKASSLFDTEEKALLSALRHAQNEWAIWKNLKLLSEKELKTANGLNERAEDAARLLADLLTSEKGRMAEACGAAMDRATQCETDYYAINKKTLARNVTLSNTIAKSQALNLSLTEPCRSSREYQQFQAVLEHNEPLVEEAKLVKHEKEEYVVAAETLKAQRIALEQSLNAASKNAHRTNSVKELMAKFEKNDSISSKRAAQLAESSLETLTSLHSIATDEAATWDKAIDSTTKEKGLYSSSNALFEEALLLQAAAASNQRERELSSTLNNAEGAANQAKEEFYSLCEVLDVKENELTTALARKDEVQKTVMATDPAILNSTAYTRTQGKLDNDHARLVASKESKDAAIAKATTLVEARLGEKASATECAGKQRRVVVEVTPTTEEDSPAVSPVPMASAALPRLDKHLCGVQYKARAVDDPPDIRPTSVGVRVNNGSTVNWQSLSAKFPDFGLAKRDQSTIHNAMQALFQERVAADAEEKSLEQATMHAVEEEKAWRLALQHAQVEVAVLDALCATAADAAGVLSGLKDDLDAQQAEEQALLEDACKDTDTEADKFVALNGECDDLGRTFEDKKQAIGAKDSELNSGSKATPEYKAFEGLYDKLSNEIEPEILTARTAKVDAADKAGKLADEKKVQLCALEAANAAQSEPEARQARTAALDTATLEAAAWAEANKHAEVEADLLRPGIGKEDEALALLDGIKTAQIQRDDDALGAAITEADAAHNACGESFAEAERKHALFHQELAKMNKMKSEILPETKASPTFRKFEKLEAELEDEDKPFISTKRVARETAANAAEELVVANQRAKPSVESAEAEKAAWSAAGDLSKEEIDGLDKGIEKTGEAQDLLGKAKLEELNKQSGDGEAGLLDAKNRAGEAEAELAQLEAQIIDARANLGHLQEENSANAAVVRAKGPEFAADIVAHDLTQKSIETALTNADTHRDVKTDYLGRAKVEKMAADEEEEAYYQGRPLSDPSMEAARRRDALVNANKRAQSQCEHLSTATTEAHAELDELLKAETAAKNDQNSLTDACSARSYRTRMGYMILSGDDELIPVPKRKPFDSIPLAPTQRKVIDATRMQRPGTHQDEEIQPPSRLPMARTEVDCDEFGDDSRPSKLLFEVGGGWTAQIAAQVKKYPPYTPPETDEYMPLRSYKHEIPKAQVSDAPPPAFFIRNDDGSVSEDRLCGKALFIAVVKHIIQLNRVVRRLKPLQEGELEEIKGRISKSHMGMTDTTQFLDDNTQLQSRAGRALNETGSADLGLSIDEMDDYGTSGPSTGTGSQLSPAVRRIASNIDAFLNDMQKKDALIVSETNSSKSNSVPTSDKTGGAFANMAKVAMKLNKVKARIPKPKGVDTAQFQPRRPVDQKSITSLLFGGNSTDSVDVAVLDDEGEDVVETTKQTTTDTTRTEEKSERHTVDEEHTEETEVTQSTTIAQRYGTNAPRITATAETSSQQSPGTQSQSQAQPPKQASPVPARSSQATTGPSSPVPLAVTSDDADFGTAYEDFHDPDFPEPSPFGSGVEDSSNGRFSPVTTSVGNSAYAQSFKSTGPDSASSTGGSGPASKKLQRATSNSSLVSSGSSKRRPADLMAEMMSGNLDL